MSVAASTPGRDLRRSCPEPRSPIRGAAAMTPGRSAARCSPARAVDPGVSVKTPDIETGEQC